MKARFIFLNDYEIDLYNVTGKIPSSAIIPFWKFVDCDGTEDKGEIQ